MAMASQIAQRALEHHRRGEWSQAADLYRKVLKAQPKNAGVRRNLGQVLAAMREFPAAKDAFAQALANDRHDIAARAGLSRALIELGDHERAIQTLAEAIDGARDRAAMQRELAGTLTQLRRIDAAIEAWIRAGEFAPDDPQPLVEAARLAMRSGLRAQAERLIDQALSIDAAHGDANVLKARLARRRGESTAAEAHLSKAIDSSSPAAVGRAYLERAVMSEQAGEYLAAFEAAERGKSALRSTMPPALLDPRPALQVIDLCREHITHEAVERWTVPSSGDDREPVFIVGFPRSGTTLIEQMLWPLEELVVTDELPLLHAVKEATSERLRLRQPYPQSLNVLSERQVQTLRQVYFSTAQAWLGDAAKSKIIVDKSPLNTVDLALVQRIFPSARVIVAIRDPRDTVLSCFFQAFTAGLPGLFDFESAAVLYAAMMRLWLHYRQTLKLRTMELRYEDLVQDAAARRSDVLQFIGVGDAAEAQPDATRASRFISTPSYEDVTRPVYQSSIGRWRNYREPFERVRPVLEPLVEALNYPPWNS